MAPVWHSVLPLASVCVCVFQLLPPPNELTSLFSLPLTFPVNWYLWQNKPKRNLSPFKSNKLHASVCIWKNNKLYMCAHTSWLGQEFVEGDFFCINYETEVRLSGCIYCMEIQFLNKWRHFKSCRCKQRDEGILLPLIPQRGARATWSRLTRHWPVGRMCRIITNLRHIVAF